VDDGLVALWANDGSLSPAEKARVLGDLARSRQELDEAWRPLAERYVELVTASVRR
jgi:hypothetical protein